MSNVLKRVSRVNQRNKLIAILFIVLVAGGILYMGRTSIVEFLSGNLSMQSGLSTSDTAVAAKLSATIGEEDVSISYAQSMFRQSIFKQAGYESQRMSVVWPDDFSYEVGSTGNKIYAAVQSDEIPAWIKITDMSDNTEVINNVPVIQGAAGDVGRMYITTITKNIDGLSVGVYTYTITAFVGDESSSYAHEEHSDILTVTVESNSVPEGIAIDSLNITLNWNTNMYKVQEDTFSLTYSIYFEASPTGIDGANDYVIEKLIQNTVNDADGSMTYKLICGTDICKVENLYNSVWNIRIRIVIEGSVLDDLGQLMESTITLDPAKIVVIWDAVFAVNGGWE